MSYPPISDYAFLSDTHTAALVGPDGAVEWFCTPRFDGASVCARILDRVRGGALEVRVDGAGPWRRRYAGDTLVAESEFDAPEGSGTVVDFLALHPPPPDQDELLPAHLLVRIVRCTRGEIRVRVTADLRPGYAADEPHWHQDDDGWRLGGQDLVVCGDLALELTDGVPSGAAQLGAGDAVVVGVAYAGPVGPVDVAGAERLLEQTRRAWQRWSDRCDYRGVAREHVLRSALVLRGLALDESGALLAAPTTSLPEWIGGERNWDYRFTWHRDASLHVLALFRLGHAQEGRRYLDFLLQPDIAGHDPLAPMAGIDGRRDAPERVLEHLEGYRGSRPVRVGNEAYTQLQLDTYGHVLDAAYVYQQLTGELGELRWRVLRRLVEAARARRREPDSGVWEVRGERLHYTYSKVMLWVCLDRGVRLAKELEPGLEALDDWRAARDELQAEVLDRGYDERVGAFVQSYGSSALDAVLLRIPLVGFLPGDDPRVVSTIDRVIDGLGSGEALVHRYDPQVAADGVGGPEGAFLLCSFDLVSALVLAGRRAEAEQRFRWLCAHAGPLGLFSEEMTPDGEALGNVPQAFTHLALIEAALNLDAAGRDEALHAWASRHRAG